MKMHADGQPVDAFSEKVIPEPYQKWDFPIILRGELAILLSSP
jgi:hypothetical protein